MRMVSHHGSMFDWALIGCRKLRRSNPIRKSETRGLLSLSLSLSLSHPPQGMVVAHRRANRAASNVVIGVSIETAMPYAPPSASDEPKAMTAESVPMARWPAFQTG